MPTTAKAEDAASVEAAAAEDAAKSSQAQFATYSADDDDSIDKDKNPPDGPHVKQEKGKPSEGAVKAFGSS